MSRRTIAPAQAKRTLLLAGTPIYDGLVTELQFDPTAVFVEPATVVVSPKAVAKRVSKKTTVNPKVTV